MSINLHSTGLNNNIHNFHCSAVITTKAKYGSRPKSQIFTSAHPLCYNKPSNTSAHVWNASPEQTPVSRINRAATCPQLSVYAPV